MFQSGGTHPQEDKDQHVLTAIIPIHRHSSMFLLFFFPLATLIAEAITCINACTTGHMNCNRVFLHTHIHTHTHTAGKANQTVNKQHHTNFSFVVFIFHMELHAGIQFDANPALLITHSEAILWRWCR